MASDMVYDHTCTPCAEDGRNAEASSYCTNCAKDYCNQCIQFHNRIHKNHMVLGETDVKDWGGIESIGFDMCQSHKDKQLEMLCRDHNQLCCTICISVSHRSCKTVDHLPDVAKGIRNNAEFKALPRAIAKFEAHLNTLKAGKKKNQKALKESCKTIRSTVNQLKKKLVSLLDDREKETIQEMDKLYATFDKAIQAEIDSCEAIRADLQKLLDNLQDMEEETAMCIGYRKCQEKLAEAENVAKNISTQDYSFSFNVDTEIEKCISTSKMLGQFEITHDVQRQVQIVQTTRTQPSVPIRTNQQPTISRSILPQPSVPITAQPSVSTSTQHIAPTQPLVPRRNQPQSTVPRRNHPQPTVPKRNQPRPTVQKRNQPSVSKDHTYSVMDKQQHNIRLKTDRYTCRITGLCVLPSGDILMVDQENETLKQLDPHFTVVNHLKLPRDPRDVCCISDTEVAVTVCWGETHHIQFVDVANRSMKLSRKLQLDHNCYGLAYHKGQLYVGSTTALYIYTMTGQLVKKVYEDNTPVFSSNIYRFVITEDDNIHITNGNNNSLITIDSEGRQLAKLTDKDIDGPRDLCIVENGSLFVCGQSAKSIAQVDNQGVKQMAIIARGRISIHTPQAVCFSKETVQLIVGQYNDDNIVVLQLK